MTKKAEPSVKTANIEWRDGTPFCKEFDDFYYRSDRPFTEHGLKETEYLFLEQNQLKQRWLALPEHQNSNNKIFVIGETGFGTGLNFLSACNLWLQTAPSDWRLQFISTELRPVAAADLQSIYDSWPVFSKLSTELINQYPALTPGIHLLNFAEGRIQLLLMLGDTHQMLKSITQSPNPAIANYHKTSVDAWFLDGFAPAKNPDMWTDDIFETLASLSSKNTTFATFTCATKVRKGLENVGFKSSKVEGFGKKRESLRGIFIHHRSESKTVSTDWHLDKKYTPKSTKNILVLGAGIAGCTAASALAKRGFNVTVIDRHRAVANEGSGNLQAVVYPKLSRQNDALPRINLTSMTLASRYYKSFWDMGIGTQCGVLLLPDSEQSKINHQQIAERYTEHNNLVTHVNNQQICELSGLELTAEQGLFFPELGWIPPQTLCQKLLDDHQIPLLTADIDHIKHCSSSRNWILKDHQGNITATAETLVIANAFECTQFPITQHLSVNQLRGQVTHIPNNRASNDLKTVICGKGYIAPTSDGVQSCGASYNKDLLSKKLRPEDHQSNLETLRKTDKGLAKVLNLSNIDNLEGRANYRCTTKDYLPIVGAVPNAQLFKQQYDALRHDASSTIDSLGSYHPDLFIHCGLGSRGLSYAPLTAEILAAEINGEIPPLERELRLAMHPARFLIRDLKRRKI